MPIIDWIPLTLNCNRSPYKLYPLNLFMQKLPIPVENRLNRKNILTKFWRKIDLLAYFLGEGGSLSHRKKIPYPLRFHFNSGSERSLINQLWNAPIGRSYSTSTVNYGPLPVVQSVITSSKNGRRAETRNNFFEKFVDTKFKKRKSFSQKISRKHFVFSENGSVQNVSRSSRIHPFSSARKIYST